VRILVVSHACVVDVNQTLYADLAKNHEVGLVAPRAWTADYGRVQFTLLRDFHPQLFLAPAGNDCTIHLHRHPRPDSVLKSFAPDLVLVEEEPSSLSAHSWCRAAYKRAIPSVFFSNENSRQERPFPQDAMQRQVFAVAAGAVAQTPAAAEVLRAEGYTGPLQVIPYAVDPARRDIRGGAAIRERLGITAPLIGYCGRLWEGKGIFDLCDALLQLPGEWQALFVGDGPDRTRLEQRVNSSACADRIFFAGPVLHRDIPAYTCACNILVVPSKTTPTWTEQLSRALQEALAWGVPVVVSDSGSNASQVEQTGGGVVFPEGDVLELRNALRRLLSDEPRRRALSRAGAQGALRLYGRAKIAAEWNSFLQLCLAPAMVKV
jgi:glycosyltransferase involved in cell wall biosynthesis